MLTLTTTKSATISPELLAIAEQLGVRESLGYFPPMTDEDQKGIIADLRIRLKAQMAEAFGNIENDIVTPASFFAIESQTVHAIEDLDQSLLTYKMRTSKTLQGMIDVLNNAELPIEEVQPGVFHSSIWAIDLNTNNLMVIVPNATLDYTLEVSVVGMEVGLAVLADFPEHEAAVLEWLKD